MKPLSQARLKAILRYDEITGDFFWLVRMSPKIRIGAKAGSLCNGYIAIGIEGSNHYAHRLAWLYVTGVMPDEVDHENQVKSDNSWKNLRLATRGQNNSNRGISKTNTSGVKGVYWHQSAWATRVIKDRKNYSAGSFKNIDDAAAAVKALRASLHGEFANA